MRTINETGNIYGNLTVLSQTASDGRGEASWLCQCGCGKKVIVLGSNLRNGRQKSCGCKKRLSEGEAAINFLYRNLKRNARDRGIEWSLTKEHVAKIIGRPCFYCGVEPYQEIKNGYNGFNGGLKYNGLDRVDNKKGYLVENVVPCCGMCNYAKRDHSVKDFKEWVSRIYHHWIEQ